MENVGWKSALLMALAMLNGCGTGSINSEKRDGNYIVVVDLPAATVADVGYAGVKPTVRSLSAGEGSLNAVAGSSVTKVINDRVRGNNAYADDAAIAERISLEKVLLLRKLDADDADFIKKKYAAQSPDYLVLVTKSRFGMSELYGAGVRQKDIPMADFHCQFFASLQLDVFELSTGKILSTLTEAQHEDCPSNKYFDDINKIDDKALAEIRENVERVTIKTANKIARHLLMTEAEGKDEFKLRLPGFE
jgi:hypothetical protein